MRSVVQVHLGPPPRTPRPAARPVAPANTVNPHRAVVQVEVATLQGSQLAPPETMRTQWLPVQAPSLKSTSTYRLVLQALRQPGVHFADVVFYECHMPVVIEQPAFDPWDMYWLFVDGGKNPRAPAALPGATCTAVRGAPPPSQEGCQSQRTTKAKARRSHSLPLLTYSRLGGLRQDPGRAAESAAGPRTDEDMGARRACVVVDLWETR